MNEFQNKVAIVTGGTSGIGRAAAVAYAREGARVVVAGRRAAEGEETVRLLRAQGGEGFFVTTDVSMAVQVKELVERTLQKFGKQGSRVTAILPGVVDTDMYQRFAGEKPEFRAQMTAMHPIGRIGKPDDIAEAAIWLSSSKSSFVTGHSLMVDGGYTAQ